MDNDNPVHVRPAPIAGDIMGHIRDTEHVREMQMLYRQHMVGCSASWRIDGQHEFRAMIYDSSLGYWVGTFPFEKEDLEPYF